MHYLGVCFLFKISRNQILVSNRVDDLMYYRSSQGVSTLSEPLIGNMPAAMSKLSSWGPSCYELSRLEFQFISVQKSRKGKLEPVLQQQNPWLTLIQMPSSVSQRCHNSFKMVNTQKGALLPKVFPCLITAKTLYLKVFKHLLKAPCCPWHQWSGITFLIAPKGIDTVLTCLVGTDFFFSPKVIIKNRILDH